jgi:hypothetical protein
MLITEYTKIKWNPKICNRYIELGYKFTKIGEEFLVSVNDLTDYSKAKIYCICDYCGKQYETNWSNYKKQKKGILNKDCCSNINCVENKSKEAIINKYGVSNIRKISGVDEKIKNTNRQKYGCENPFGSKFVQEKIRNHYLDKYGVEHNMKLPECVKKARDTTLSRYGVEHYTHTKEWKFAFSGSNNPNWKGNNATTVRNGRELPEYREWRKYIFDRDKYTCRCCGKKNGNGKYIRLEAHHIFNWKDNISLRYDKTNGATLCQNCHIYFHKIYGKKNNTQLQFDEFVNNYKIDEKIC